jgi:serine/threonine-protein kinase
VSEERSVLEGQLVLGRYRILKPLARGGMGVVYLGRIEGAAGFSKPVVVKRVLPHLDDQEDSRRQFVREAHILSNLQHPAIVGVIDFAEESDAYVMVLEYVHGYHLGHWLRFVRDSRGHVAWDQAVLVILRVLAGLQYAHCFTRMDGQRMEIIHRDVSPSNILIDLEGNVRLLDFGIARAKGDTDEFRTGDGIVKGKLSFIAPEVFGSTRASASSDLYACGVVLYQLIAGRNPFAGGETSETIRRVLYHTPEPLSELRKDVPAALDAVIARALAKAPADRYASAEEFSGALRELLPRSEAAVFADFKATIRSDFTGAMPQQLCLEPLTSLESAWREAAIDQAGPESVLRSSVPPPMEGDATIVGGTPLHLKKQVTTSATASALASTRAPATPAPGVSRKLLLAGILGATLVATTGSLAAAYLMRAPASQEPKLLVVERSSAEESTPTIHAAQAEPAAPVPAEAPPAAASAAPEAPSARTSTAQPAATKPMSTAEKLSRTFAARQGAIQGCFNQNAAGLEGAPQLSVRFGVAADGSVTTASLVPAQAASTPLGQCILGVARSTSFGPQGAPVGFTIPITARVVKR